MKTEYCPHCGAKHTYDAVAPKFCSNCGQPMESSRASRPKEEGPIRGPRSPAPGSEEEQRAQRPSFPNKIEYTIEGKPMPPRKLEDLLKETPDGEAPSRPTRPKTTPDESVKESMGSCLSARESKEVGE